MRLPRRRLLLVAAVVLALAGCGGVDGAGPGAGPGSAPTPSSTVSGPSQDPSSGDAAGGAVPAVLDFVADDTEGNRVDGADLAGQDVVLWFWAPWCTVCARAAEEVREVSGARDDVQVVGVGGLSSDPGALDRFVAQNDVGDLVHLADVDGDLYTRFGISQQHSFVLLHADGEAETVTAYGTDIRLADLVEQSFG